MAGLEWEVHGEAIKVHVQHTADLSQYDTHIKVVASSQLK